MDLFDLLQKTSRSFALAIPMLPAAPAKTLGLSYLVFRVADTFEDATQWPSKRRLEALERFEALLLSDVRTWVESASGLSQWALAVPPVEHAGYLELLEQLGNLMQDCATLEVAERQALVKTGSVMMQGMRTFIARTGARGELQLTDSHDLRRYCYVVAGVVGELVTELFLMHSPSLQTEAPALKRTMVEFGEGLQLVNILKDMQSDAAAGRVYLPPSMSKGEAFALARRGLESALEYIEALERSLAPVGFVQFTAVSVALALRTLRRLEEPASVPATGREEVFQLVASLQEATLNRATPAFLASMRG
jgi:farnesyl-diphosphate farnesyltransferase